MNSNPLSAAGDLAMPQTRSAMTPHRPMNHPTSLLAQMAEAQERMTRENMRADMKAALSEVVQEATLAKSDVVVEKLMEKLDEREVSKVTSGETAMASLRATLNQEASTREKVQKQLLGRITLVLVLLVLLAALGVWLMVRPKEAPPQPVSPPQPTLTATTLTPPAEITSAKEEWLKEIDRLQTEARNLVLANRTDSDRLRAQTEATTTSLTAMQQMMASAREELTQLQKLQLAYQFRLMPAEDGSGKVFVRIPAGARPITMDGQTYIEVAE